MANELLDMLKGTVNELDGILNDPESWLKDYGYEEDEDALSLWFEDTLSIDVISALGTKAYRGAQILLTSGGPTIWIDTKSCTVEGRWGLESQSVPIYSDVCEMLDDYISEFAGMEY